MSVSRPARCIFSASAIPIRPRPQCRSFHATPSARRRSRFRNVKASEMGLVRGDATSKPGTASLKPYTEEEKRELAKKYTPDQLKVIEAGEEAVDVEDIKVQGFLRLDPYRLPYLDDLSVVRPVIDKRPQFPSTVPEDAVPLNEEQTFDEISQWMDDVYKESMQNKPLGQAFDPENPSQPTSTGAEGEETEAWQPSPRGKDLLKLFEESSGMTGGGTSGSYNTAPALPKIPELVTEIDAEGGKPDDNAAMREYLEKATGLTRVQIQQLSYKVLVAHRVVNQTRLGKIQSFYSLAACGNRQGRLGIGEGKATELEDAMSMARINAIRNMIPIPMYENRTIYGEVDGKVSGTVVKLMSRPPGFGLRCQHNIFEIARLAGISDLAARTPRSRNRMNVCKAVWQALQKQRVPDDIARGRGRKLVDVRKVYYGGDQEVDPVFQEPHQRGRRGSINLSPESAGSGF